MLKRVILTRFLKNKLAAIGFCLLIIFVLAAIFAPFLSGYGRDTIDLMNIESQPSLKHLFGNR